MKRFIIIFLLLTGCQSLMRHSDSGYVPAESSSMAPHEVYTTRLDERERYLRRLEADLDHEEDIRMYNEYKAVIPTTQQKIDFLEQKGTHAKENWLRQRGLSLRKETFKRQVASIVDEGDIIVGMGMDGVRDSWGQPAHVEVAGDSKFGNQRWIYQDYIATPEGYNPQTKIVYFENGGVVGWERR